MTVTTRNCHHHPADKVRPLVLWVLGSPLQVPHLCLQTIALLAHGVIEINILAEGMFGARE